ncbi:MAG: hypothetical protein ACFHXK_13240 [bacterium]
MATLYTHLQEHFDASQTGELDLRVRFDWREGHLDAHIGPDGLRWIDADNLPDAQAEPELTLFFSNEQCALDIFTGKRSPIDAFMHADFRSSGYIVWTFALLRLFAAPIPPAPAQGQA